TLEPVGYVVPSLPPDVPAVALVNNFLRPGPDPSELERMAQRRVLDHRGPLLLLARRSAAGERYYSGESIPAMLAELGLRPDLGQCSSVQTGLDGDDLALCRLERTPAPVPGASRRD
ncbi:MAG TPA: hypothetical protein VFI16_02890, partial [Anaeromyxobacteraceae bacterium]|nr:hypothetical protein [Anaeromyxobacteraceae bacterium]